MCQAGKIKKQKNFLHLDTGKKRDILKHTHKKGVKSDVAQVLRTLRFSQLRFRRNVPPCGGMCAALMFRRFNVPAARRRPTFRRWITPGYDPGRDSFFFIFFIFYPATPAPRTTGCDILCVASIRAAWFARSGDSRNDQAATTERRDIPLFFAYFLFS